MGIDQGNFLHGLGAVRQRMFAFLEAELARRGVEGICPAHGELLRLLDRHGPLSPQRLAALCFKDKSTVSNLVKSLEKAGYVVRAPQPGDGRGVVLALSEKALALKPLLLEVAAAMNQRLFAGLGPAEKEALCGLMDKLWQGIKDQDRDQGGGGA